MHSRLFTLYEKSILRYPKAVLFLALLVIAALATQIREFKLDASADSLVLEGDEDLKYYREVSRRYQTEDFLLVTFTPSGELFSDTVLKQIRALRDDLAVLSGVASVVTILDVPLLNSPTLSLDEIASGVAPTLLAERVDRELAIQEFRDSPIYRDLLTSRNNQTTALQINLVRDKRYFELLERRQLLREKRDREGLSDGEIEQLVQAERNFRDYAVEYNDRQTELVKDVRLILDDYRQYGQLFLGGVPMITSDMISFVKSDIAVFGVGIVILIVLTLLVIFRHPVWVILPLAISLLTAVFMLGLITWLDWRMTVISSNFLALLIIITLSITIHLVVRYREFLATNPDMDQPALVRETTFRMIKPCVFMVLTTNVAFASLVFSGIRPVIDFGWMMTVGVTVALVMVFIFFPCVMLLLPRPAVPNNGRAASTTLFFANMAEQRGRFILGFSLVLAVLCVVGISRLEVENRFIDYFDESTEIYQGMEVIDEQLGGTIPLEVIIRAPEKAVQEFQVDPEALDDETLAEADAFFDDDFASDFDSDGGDDEPVESSVWFNKAGLTRIEQVHDYLDGLEETGKVLSLATPYKVLKQLTSGIDDIQLALLKKNLPREIDQVLVEPYLRDEQSETRITVRVKETSRNLKRDELLKEVRNHLQNELGFEPDQFRLTGMLVLYNNMLQSLYRSQILTLGVVFLAIMLMFVVLFRSLKIAVLAIAPNILAAATVLGGMGWFGLSLDIMTVTIAAIVVGIGVDDTVHYVHRFINEFSKDRNYHATMFRCHGSIGRAMFYTSITVVMGFSILVLSNFTPSIYFGLLTAAAMVAALMGALLLLPRLLISFQALGPEAGQGS